MGAFDDLIPGGRQPGGMGTPKIKADALSDYQSAMQLGNVIKDIEAKFNAGPGATSGLAGILDYLPLPQNEALNVASDQLRGFVKSAQGMTGGENNTATESRMNIGPFIPNSKDYDNVVRDKLAALRRERERALKTSIAIMGGVPDANGNITPVRTTAPPAAQPKRMIGGRTAPAPMNSIDALLRKYGG